MNKRLLSSVVGLGFGFLVGIIFISVLGSIFQTTGAYDYFAASHGFTKILVIYTLIPTVVFSIKPESWESGIKLSIALMIAAFIIINITMIFPTIKMFS